MKMGGFSNLNLNKTLHESTDFFKRKLDSVSRGSLDVETIRNSNFPLRPKNGGQINKSFSGRHQTKSPMIRVLGITVHVVLIVCG